MARVIDRVAVVVALSGVVVIAEVDVYLVVVVVVMDDVLKR